MRKSPIFIRSATRAVHLIITGYGHWLPNDPRGSGSSSIRAPKLKDYGPIHFGRKKQQPSGSELRAFHRNADAKLEHPVLWFDEKMRNAIAHGIEQAQSEAHYTIFACAILRNHIHLVIRTHRDKSMEMLARIAGHAHDAIHAQKLAPQGHPVWSNRPYKVYLRRDAQIRQVIRYVEQNPIKEGLAPQKWSFVVKFEKKNSSASVRESASDYVTDSAKLGIFALVSPSQFPRFGNPPIALYTRANFGREDFLKCHDALTFIPSSSSVQGPSSSVRAASLTTRACRLAGR